MGLKACLLILSGFFLFDCSSKDKGPVSNSKDAVTAFVVFQGTFHSPVPDLAFNKSPGMAPGCFSGLAFDIHMPKKSDSIFNYYAQNFQQLGFGPALPSMTGEKWSIAVMDPGKSPSSGSKYINHVYFLSKDSNIKCTVTIFDDGSPDSGNVQKVNLTCEPNTKVNPCSLQNSQQ